MRGGCLQTPGRPPQPGGRTLPVLATQVSEAQREGRGYPTPGGCSWSAGSNPGRGGQQGPPDKSLRWSQSTLWPASPPALHAESLSWLVLGKPVRLLSFGLMGRASPSLENNPINLASGRLWPAAKGVWRREGGRRGAGQVGEDGGAWAEGTLVQEPRWEPSVIRRCLGRSPWWTGPR